MVDLDRFEALIVRGEAVMERLENRDRWFEKLLILLEKLINRISRHFLEQAITETVEEERKRTGMTHRQRQEGGGGFHIGSRGRAA